MKSRRLLSSDKSDDQTVIPVKLGIVSSFVVKGSKTVIVDTGYPGNANRLLACLRESGIGPEDVSLVIITHGHIDHYGSAEELKKMTGAPTAMHRVDAEDLGKGFTSVGSPATLAGAIVKSLFTRGTTVKTRKLDVDLVLGDDTDLRPFGVEGRIVHTPGHTEGSVSLVFSGGEAVVGDLLMGGLLFRSVPHYPLFATDKAVLRKSIDRVLGLAPEIIYPAHGRPFSAQAVKELLRRTS